MSARVVIHADIATFTDLEETIRLFIPIASPFDRECLAVYFRQFADVYFRQFAGQLTPPVDPVAKETRELEKETTP